MKKMNDAYWMPFTANRQFKSQPRILVSASGMYYQSDDGRDILDAVAGLWCCNIGHNHPQVVRAIQQQAAKLDYAPPFQMGHPLAFELAERLSAISPDEMNHVFFTNSGSESVDTALKIALAYQQRRNKGAKTRLIGRERGYHGVGFGGISVGGMVANRKSFGSLLSGVDHLRHTHDLASNAFSKGLPEHGAALADDLSRLVLLHGAETIAAVIVEPIAGSTGVLMPPKGYLKRLRQICDANDILLIFDEVITGFGRLGKAFAAQAFEVTPDIMTTAKGLTSGTVPMGAVLVKDDIYDSFMQGPEHMIELFHGYTFSSHPLACTAALATLDVYDDEDLFGRVNRLAIPWQNALHELADAAHVIDIRNYGLIGAIELEARAGEAGQRGYETFVKCFEAGVLTRVTGDTIALSPPFIIEEGQMEHVMTTIRQVLNTVA